MKSSVRMPASECSPMDAVAQLGMVQVVCARQAHAANSQTRGGDGGNEAADYGKFGKKR
jgi:hypothetical protein